MPPAEQTLPPSRRKALGFFCALLMGPLPAFWTTEPPALVRANVYRPGIDLSAYWLSEKYDGVRAFWDGHRLLTRSGLPIVAPAWFTADWPSQPMDGELWSGRGRFEDTVSTVRQQWPDDAAWRQVQFMVFDLPAHPGVFTERKSAYEALVGDLRQPWVVAVPQERVADDPRLLRRLDQVVRAGGEGLMLRRADAPYRAERSDDLLKVKTHEDAEARVIGHEPGRGKHQGRLGALVVETPEGRRFRIGSGFTDEQREQPPPVGSWVTYRFRGQHESGLPRFATFVRVRADADLNGLPPIRP